jgi:hypothetical protein
LDILPGGRVFKLRLKGKGLYSYALWYFPALLPMTILMCYLVAVPGGCQTGGNGICEAGKLLFVRPVEMNGANISGVWVIISTSCIKFTLINSAYPYYTGMVFTMTIMVLILRPQWF